jgi:hypothetical protein
VRRSQIRTRSVSVWAALLSALLTVTVRLQANSTGLAWRALEDFKGAMVEDFRQQ